MSWTTRLEQSLKKSGSGQAHLFQYFRRRAVEIDRWDVADVLEVLHPFGRGIKTTRREIAELGEEMSGPDEVLFGSAHVTNVVADRSFLRVGEFGKLVLGETLQCLRV